MWVWQRRWTFISRVCCVLRLNTYFSCDATSARFAFVGEATTVAELALPRRSAARLKMMRQLLFWRVTPTRSAS